MFKDKTKKQHFISVSEQRLNSSNPLNTKRNKIKVYSFDLLDRENHLIRLSKNSEINAEGNLMEVDLFTFGFLDDGQRLCFEKLFGRLESKVADCTNKILDNVRFTVDDFLNVFKAKLLNMIRNPYCIRYTLNNFGNLNDLYPRKTDLQINFNRISKHNISNEILNKYDVSAEEYKNWLKIIFLMITPLHTDQYILDTHAENFFNLEKYYHIINLCKYTEDNCLMSDRGYVNLSSLFDDVGGLCFGFNLRRDAFIYLTFLPNDLEELAKKFKIPCSLNMMKSFKRQGIKTIQTNLAIQLYVDNKELLKNYNRHVIYQCEKNVYASSKKVLV